MTYVAQLRIKSRYHRGLSNKKCHKIYIYRWVNDIPVSLFFSQPLFTCVHIFIYSFVVVLKVWDLLSLK